MLAVMPPVPFSLDAPLAAAAVAAVAKVATAAAAGGGQALLEEPWLRLVVYSGPCAGQWHQTTNANRQEVRQHGWMGAILNRLPACAGAQRSLPCMHALSSVHMVWQPKFPVILMAILMVAMLCCAVRLPCPAVRDRSQCCVVGHYQ
jgi:hypothetical protein